MTKDMMVKAFSDFMASKGVKTMDLATYKSFGNDVPVKDYILRRKIGSWNRLLSYVEKRHPVSLPEPVKKVAPKKVEPKKVAPKKTVKVEKKDGK
jgi:hypothetical protein